MSAPSFVHCLVGVAPRRGVSDRAGIDATRETDRQLQFLANLFQVLEQERIARASLLRSIERTRDAEQVARGSDGEAGATETGGEERHGSGRIAESAAEVITSMGWSRFRRKA